MANSTPWSERSGAQRRRTFGGFAALYGAIAVLAIAFGWIPIGIIFAIGTIALGIAWMSTDSTPAAPTPERAKPDWLLAMDDPDAPDRSLPEYRTKPRTSPDADPSSPFAPPESSTDRSPDLGGSGAGSPDAPNP